MFVIIIFLCRKQSFLQWLGKTKKKMVKYKAIERADKRADKRRKIIFYNKVKSIRLYFSDTYSFA